VDLIASLLLLGVLVFDTVSHLGLKAASGRASGTTDLKYIGTFMLEPAFWLAIAAFAAVFLCWLAFLQRVPLGQGVMAGSITIVGVMLGGRIWFGERLTRPRVIAICLIAIGVALVGWGTA
jgi:drug/metabolite transporter (DMT)-like permease